MSKLLILLIAGAVIFNNLGGTNEPKQTISEKEGERIAERLGSYLKYKDQEKSKRIGNSKPRQRLGNNQERYSEKNKNSTKCIKPILRKRVSRKVSQALVYKYADKYDVMRIALWRMVLAESGGNIYASNPPYYGLMQWRKSDYLRQARAYGYKCPDIFDPDQHLDVSARAISEGQEWRWPNTKHFLTDYYVDI